MKLSKQSRSLDLRISCLAMMKRDEFCVLLIGAGNFFLVYFGNPYDVGRCSTVNFQTHDMRLFQFLAKESQTRELRDSMSEFDFLYFR